MNTLPLFAVARRPCYNEPMKDDRFAVARRYKPLLESLGLPEWSLRYDSAVHVPAISRIIRYLDTMREAHRGVAFVASTDEMTDATILQGRIDGEPVGHALVITATDSRRDGLRAGLGRPSVADNDTDNDELARKP